MNVKWFAAIRAVGEAVVSELYLDHSYHRVFCLPPLVYLYPDVNMSDYFKNVSFSCHFKWQ